MTIREKLAIIQSNLDVPKKRWNSHGQYSYRSCEDILNAIKPLAEEVRAIVVLGDELISIDSRHYVKSTAYLLDLDSETGMKRSSFAGHPAERKGMDSSQITGAASSYSRKYALNALFAIDDTEDADTMDNRKQGTQTTKQQPQKKDVATDEQKKTIAVLAAKLFGTEFKDNLKPIKSELGLPESAKNYTDSDAKKLILNLEAKLKEMENKENAIQSR